MVWVAIGVFVLLAGIVLASLDARLVTRVGRVVLMTVLTALGLFLIVRDVVLLGVICLMAAALLLTFGPTAGAWIAGRVRSPGKQSRQSVVETAWLHMVLDHASGETSGHVRKGRFAGARLDEMDLPSLQQVLAELEPQDNDSAQLLRAYIARLYPDADMGGGDEAGAGRAMSPAEAREVLGLKETATRHEIIEAHRRLMKTYHPDKGGSGYFAAKLNQARDILLDRARSA